MKLITRDGLELLVFCELIDDAMSVKFLQNTSSSFMKLIHQPFVSYHEP